MIKTYEELADCHKHCEKIFNDKISGRSGSEELSASVRTSSEDIVAASVSVSETDSVKEDASDDPTGPALWHADSSKEAERSVTDAAMVRRTENG